MEVEKYRSDFSNSNAFQLGVFCVDVEQLAAGRLPTGAPALGMEPAAGPAAQRLAEIKALLEAGLITEQDYEDKKAQILAQL